ncbi:MAG: hypothetical protein ACPGTQ_13310 [Colwellia sp.]
MKNLVLISIMIMLSYIIYLSIEVENLKSNNQILVNKLNASVKKNTPTIFTETLSIPKLITDESEEPIVAEEIIENRDEMIADNVQIKSVDEHLSNKKKPYEEQSIDEEWAYEFSDKIFYFFSEHPELTYLDVKEIECRETTCKVNIAIYDNDSILTSQKVARALKEDKTFGEYQFYFDSEPIDGVIRIELDSKK